MTRTPVNERARMRRPTRIVDTALQTARRYCRVDHTLVRCAHGDAILSGRLSCCGRSDEKRHYMEPSPRLACLNPRSGPSKRTYLYRMLSYYSGTQHLNIQRPLC